MYAQSTVEQKRTLYKEWAETYDDELQTGLGYVGPAKAVELFCTYVPQRDALVLDAGCGTGLVGGYLHDKGYDQIHGVDFSPEMLARAEALGVYRSLQEADLTQPLQTGTSYDALISVGLFGFGPPLVEHLHHLRDVIKPDGLGLITVNGRGWVEAGWEQALPVEVEKHNLVIRELLEIDYLTKENIEAKVIILGTTGSPALAHPGGLPTAP